MTAFVFTVRTICCREQTEIDQKKTLLKRGLLHRYIVQ